MFGQLAVVGYWVIALFIKILLQQSKSEINHFFLIFSRSSVRNKQTGYLLFRLVKLRSSGVIHLIHMRLFGETLRTNNLQIEGVKPIAIRPTLPVLALILIGIVLSWIILCLELSWNRFMKY